MPMIRRNIFADKATLVLRKMLSNPGNKWVVRDFTGGGGVSLGMAQGVLEAMRLKGYIEWVKRGPHSYAIFTNTDELLNDWLVEYRFEFNNTFTYYSPDKKILSRLKACLKDKKYALTLHSGTNLITSFVMTDHIHLYLAADNWENSVLDLRQRLELKELVRGGNVHIIQPHYKNSVFYGVRVIKGYRVVSNLQLYLDLNSFRPRGSEHAEYFRMKLEEQGNNLYEL